MNIIYCHRILQKQYKGNISLIMLFVLAIGSLIGLMSTWFVQDMISSSSQIRDFYQSYYIAKWGLELGILATNKYEFGFEDYLSGSSDIIKNNLNCQKDCNLEIEIKSRIKSDKDMMIDNNLEPIQVCNTFTPNKFILGPAESYILPLFADQRKLSKNSGSPAIQNILWNPSYSFTINSNVTYPLSMGVALWSTNQNEYNLQDFSEQQRLSITGSLGEDNFTVRRFLYNTPGIDTTNPSPSMSIATKFAGNPNPNTDKEDRFNYLYITNLSSTQPLEYCITIQPSAYGFISDKSIITAISTYGDTSLWLQAQSRKPLLEYIIRPNTEYSL